MGLGLTTQPMLIGTMHIIPAYNKAQPELRGGGGGLESTFDKSRRCLMATQASWQNTYQVAEDRR